MTDATKDALSSDIEYLNGVAEGRSQANAQFRAKLECAEERIRQLEAQLDSAEQRGRTLERESILSYLEGWWSGTMHADRPEPAVVRHRCTIPTCRKPLNWPAPGLCADCYDHVYMLRELEEREESDDADAE